MLPSKPAFQFHETLGSLARWHRINQRAFSVSTPSTGCRMKIPSPQDGIAARCCHLVALLLTIHQFPSFCIRGYPSLCPPERCPHYSCRCFLPLQSWVDLAVSPPSLSLSPYTLPFSSLPFLTFTGADTHNREKAIAHHKISHAHTRTYIAYISY